jgi:hypothetical protein
MADYISASHPIQHRMKSQNVEMLFFECAIKFLRELLWSSRYRRYGAGL